MCVCVCLYYEKRQKQRQEIWVNACKAVYAYVHISMDKTQRKGDEDKYWQLILILFAVEILV